MSAQDLINIAEISGKEKVGELFGVFESDHDYVKSTLNTYTYAGKLTVDGVAVENECLIGSGHSISASNGTLYEAPEEAPENGENTEEEGENSTAGEETAKINQE